MNKGLFLVTPRLDPYVNMGMDEYFFGEIEKSECEFIIILRLYTWDRPAVTIGYNQDDCRAINWELVDERLPIIRRITGGRAIYHNESEITFSLIADSRVFGAFGNALSAVNSKISESVVEILNYLGIKSSWINRQTRIQNNGPITAQSCFNSATRFEILSNGQKIVGGAQRRRGRFLIHQGSLKPNGVEAFPAINQKPQSPIYDDINQIRYGIGDFAVPFLNIFSSNLRIIFEKRAIEEFQTTGLNKMIEIIRNESLRKR
jgi:lipoate-protein ligase A